MALRAGAPNPEVMTEQSQTLVALAMHPAVVSGDVATAVRSITEAAARVLLVDRVSIWRFDEENQEDGPGIVCQDLFKRVEARHEHGARLRARDFPRYFAALRADLTIAADDAASDARTSEFAKDYLAPLGITSMLDAPIRVGGRVVGVLCHEHVGSQRTWSAIEQLLSGMLADIVGAAWAQAQRHELEQQLRHSQKLEAIGLLAGGVAHDFNNLLTAITGNAALLRLELADSPSAIASLDEIQTSAELAASLTSKLLAFSRRQVLRPRPLDACQITQDLIKVLRRLVGERVQLTLSMAGGDAWIETDPGQLEQVLLNLAINAKEAMPSGGQLDISITRCAQDEHSRRRFPRLPLSDFVLLSVTDSGVGMDDATRARVFEPFFTTKAVGHGTGLGLSTVYGIVQQSGGSIAVESRLGAGTRFDIAFPALNRSDTPLRSPSIVASGRETLLVAEDDVQVCTLIHRYFTHLGYEVWLAEHGRAALDLLRKNNRKPQLLLTDVVMPEMTGPELAHEVRQFDSSIPVLFMSGHSPTIALDGEFIAKPFLPSALAQKIRLILDHPSGVAPELRPAAAARVPHSVPSASVISDNNEIQSRSSERGRHEQ